MASDATKKVLARYADVLDGKPVGVPANAGKYGSYAVTMLRGGVGKSTLAFNLAYEISRTRSLLVADLSADAGLTAMVTGGERPELSIQQPLAREIAGQTEAERMEDFSYLLSDFREEFKGGKRCYFIPGASDLHSIPQSHSLGLQAALARRDIPEISRLLLSLKTILTQEAKLKGCDKILMDTSPFFDGGTHLAWCAADALIIPVGVNTFNLASLGTTLEMLNGAAGPFRTWNVRGGGASAPKIASIVVTTPRSTSRTGALDMATATFLDHALELAEDCSDLFAGDPSDAFVLMSDLASSGHICRAKGIPISALQAKHFVTASDGRRLQVNSSVERYKQEFRYLAQAL